MRFGLSESEIAQLSALFERFPDVISVTLYGSRALGTQKLGSDIDLTMRGTSALEKVYLQIIGEIDDLSIPHKVDLSIFDQIENDSLKEHILRVGMPFYQKKV